MEVSNTVFIEIPFMKRREAITLGRTSIIPIFDCRISRTNCFHNLFDLDQMPCFSAPCLERQQLVIGTFEKE